MKKTVLLMIIAGMTCLFFCGCSSSGNAAAQRLIDNWPAGVVEAVNAVSDRCIESSDGNGSAVYFWKTDEYLLSPAPEKLLKTDFNRINSIANYEYQAAFYCKQIKAKPCISSIPQEIAYHQVAREMHTAA